MKTYTLLGHRFELQDRAFLFLKSYIDRIENYAKSHAITNDIVNDIKYSVIEKLYEAKAPLSEVAVMNIAEVVGEPDQIFEIKESSDTIDSTENKERKNRIQRRLGTDRPLIRGVAYWIAKSLKIDVAYVRSAFILLILVFGTSIWLYLLLALFVPFKDKSSTTGKSGNLFFEFIRILVWGGIILFLGFMSVVALVGIIGFPLIPNFSNQSLQALVPLYVYPLAILALVSLLILLIGAIGALFKRSRTSKTIAIIASSFIFFAIIVAGVISVNIIGRFAYTPSKEQITEISSSVITGDQVVINLSTTGEDTKMINLISHRFLEEFVGDQEVFQDISLVAAKDDQVSVRIIDSTIGADTAITDKYTSVKHTLSGNELTLTIPNDIFSQKVPFVAAHRIIQIAIPTDKVIIYNNQSRSRFATSRSWFEYSENNDKPTKQIYCNDTNSFKFYTEYAERRCANTSFALVNQETDDRDSDEYEQDMNLITD